MDQRDESVFALERLGGDEARELAEQPGASLRAGSSTRWRARARASRGAGAARGARAPRT